ncbi:hypothetical protein PVW48_08460 [Dinoroseobacter sp. PD6]|uniref:hypothetical protein n=1 Tax=Dinoroseobacter sp. PD6 TaxID=3028384 RepID=UPI00237B665B|nr:hypothetical protein [Dinoroseobacter sp. PD6]MDD9716772.1 hypothetical protein [Dinoroseobacter sp. PD6]
MVCEVVRENGLGEIPFHRTSAKSWFQGNGIATITDRSDGRNPEFVRLYDLPAPERLAYLTRELEHLHLSPGSYDAAAHEAFLAASPSRRDRAERRAAVARVLVALGLDVNWSDRLRIVHEKFGVKGLSKPRLKAILRAVEGVDPINFAPALLDDYKGTTARQPFDPAWRTFMTLIRDAGPDWPLKSAMRDVRDIGAMQGWHVPSYPTFYRRCLSPTRATCRAWVTRSPRRWGQRAS